MVKSKGGKGKDGKKTEAQRSFSIQKKLAAKGENPFDKFSNAKKKHEVLNRRVKGEDRNVGRAREKAVEDRRKRLLGDWQNSKKANSFNDRRFGEDDADLSLEEKMFARFQKEKVKKARNISMFNLDADGDNTEMLTHKGSVLGDGNFNDGDGFSDDEDDNLNKDVVSNLHFGGGMVRKEGSGNDGDDGDDIGRNSRLNALQEIVMKSKLAKMEKKEAKKEQEDGRELLDKAFEELMGNSMLEYRDKGKDREKKKDDKESNDINADYDQSLSKMAYEVKVQASDRTKTVEEIAIEERDKLDELERERIKRMSGELGLNDQKSEDKTADDKRVKKRKNNNHNEEEGEEEEEQEEVEEEEEVDEDEMDEDDEESGDDGYSEDGFESQNKGLEESKTKKSKSEIKKNATNYAASKIVNKDMPHTLPCPTTIELFNELVQKYVLSTVDYLVLVERIVNYNSVKLPGQVGKDNKTNMHNFLDIIMRSFMQIGDSIADVEDDEEENNIMAQLDGLAKIIFKLNVDLPDSSSPLWGRTLNALVKQLQKRLRDHAQGVRQTCWPSLGTLMLFRLLAHCYPVTDFRHPIVTPAVLMLCQCLSQCPVQSESDVSSGLFVCSILSIFTHGTERFMPEVQRFLYLVFSLFRSSQNTDSMNFEIIGNGTGTLDKKKLIWFESAINDEEQDMGKIPFKLKWSFFSSGSQISNRRAVASSCLATALELSRNLFKKHMENEAFPEMFAPLISSLETKITKVSKKSYKGIVYLNETQNAVYSEGIAILKRMSSTRLPLQWRKSSKSSIESKVPRFDLDYTFKKDLEPDAEKAKMKQLSRQLKREQKAAMRELRRDAEFMDNHAFAEKTEAHETRKAERAKNFAFMEEQQATINLQVRKGGSLMKGAGSSAARKPQVKRK